MRKLTHSKYSSNDRLLIVNIREKKLQSREITDCSFFQHTILFSAYHQGSFDSEPATVALLEDYLKEQGYENDINEQRLHHEIYMSDARKVAPEKWKTVIRHPIKKV